MYIPTYSVLNKCSSSALNARCLSNYNSVYYVLTKYFELHHNYANYYLDKERLGRLDPSKLMKSINFCKKLGYDNESILENPVLLRASVITLEQNYLLMKESSFVDIKAAALSKFRTYYRKKISSLKDANLIKQNVSVSDSCIQYLNPRPDNFYVTLPNEDEEVLSDVHAKILCEYLKWRLQTTDDKIRNLLQVHPGCRHKSFQFLCKNIAFAEELGFTKEKLLKYGYLIQAYPKYAEEVLEKFPEIAGASMKRAMKMYPKLVTTSPSNIEKIYKILKEYDIPDIAIRKRMNIFHLSPETVRFRLEELKRDSELKVLFHNPRILKLIVHHNRAKSRLSFLRKLEIKCTGVSVLGTDDDKFQNYINESRDVNTRSDIEALLKGLFKKEVEEFESTLKKHPYFLYVPLVVMEESYHYLISQNFSSDSIFQVIYILLYSKESLEDGLQQLNSFIENRQEKNLSQIQKLNLILYFIERECNFTGEGSWRYKEQEEIRFANEGS